MTHLILQTSTDSLSIAKIIAKKLIDNGLSPCVHIINSPTTIYKWEGKTINTKEYLIQIKTTDLHKVKIRIIKLQKKTIKKKLIIKRPIQYIKNITE